MTICRLFNSFKINFILPFVLFIINIATTSVAFCNTNQNFKPNIYTDFEYQPIKNKDASLFLKMGFESFVTDKMKLTAEYGRLLAFYREDYIFESKKTALNFALDIHNNNYFTQTEVNFLYCDQQNKANAVAKLGTEFTIFSNFYIQPKLCLTAEGVSEQISQSPNKSKIHSSKLFAGSEMVMGANFYIKNTNIRLNPEIVASYNTNLISDTGYNSCVSANISCDFDNFIYKVSYGYSDKSVSGTYKETLAVKFGLKI
jgi:hypothetical protein